MGSFSAQRALPRRASVVRLEAGVEVAQPIEPALAREAVRLEQVPVLAHDGLQVLQEVGLLAAARCAGASRA